MIVEVKKLVLKNVTTSLYAVIQRCQVHESFVFYRLYCSPKEKDHIRRKPNSKKKNIYVWNQSYILLICQKLELVGPVQQKIKLPSQTRGVFKDPYKNIYLMTEIWNLFIQKCNEIVLKKWNKNKPNSLNIVNILRMI